MERHARCGTACTLWHEMCAVKRHGRCGLAPEPRSRGPSSHKQPCCWCKHGAVCCQANSNAASHSASHTFGVSQASWIGCCCARCASWARRWAITPMQTRTTSGSARTWFLSEWDVQQCFPLPGHMRRSSDVAFCGAPAERRCCLQSLERPVAAACQPTNTPQTELANLLSRRYFTLELAGLDAADRVTAGALSQI